MSSALRCTVIMVRQIVWMYHLLVTVKFRIQRRLFRKSQAQTEFRILLFHEVAKCEEERFASQIDACSRDWTFTNPAALGKSEVTSSASTQRSLVLTFDDGYVSSFDVAQTVLNPRGIKAIFFIIPEFVDLVDIDEQVQFIRTKLFPKQRLNHIPPHLRSMSWEQVVQLCRQGHMIGSHSLSHTRLSDISGIDEFAREIVDSRRVIEEKTEQKVEHFAYPFGDLRSISPTALKIAREHYKFVHSGLRGNNSPLSSIRVLRRETVSPWDPVGFETAVLAGADDSRYRTALSILDNWTQFSSKSSMQ